MRARDLMSPVDADCCLYPNSLNIDAVEKFHKHRFEALPVINGDGRLVGVFSKRSLYKCLLKGAGLKDEIKEFYIRQVVSVNCNKRLDTLVEIRNTPVAQWVVVDEDNRPVGMLSMIDIVLYLLRNTETLMTELSAILNAIPIGVIAIDRNGLVRLFNPAAEKLLDRPAESIVEKPLSDVMQDFSLEKVLLSGTAQVKEKRRLDRRTVIFSGHPIRQGNQTCGAIGIVQDLTEFENVSQELESVRRLQKTLETILASVDNGIAVTDEKGVILSVNQAALALLEKNAEVVQGKKFYEVFGSRIVDTVLQKGSSEVDMGNIGGQSFLMTSNPMLESGAVVGTVTNLIFKNLAKFKSLVDRLNLLEGQLKHYQKELSNVTASRYNFNSILTRSEAMIKLKQEAMAAAAGFSNILIMGESGTGKELFAHAIHGASSRRMGPFIKVNCAAIPENLLESEFFGYEEGAFTGAKKGGKPGKIELAHGGTVFLDEIGDMPLLLQAKILRVLQEREFERVGGTKTIQVDVRIIAATNKNLLEMVNKGLFRQDLYYRLNVISLQVPPLRKRREDIMYIADHFVKHFNRIMGIEVKGFSAEARLIMENYDWPGNVRELANVVERAMNMNVKDYIGVDHLTPYLLDRKLQTESTNSLFGNYREALAVYERALMLEALKEAGGSFRDAASLLGMSRSRFYEKASEYDIRVTDKKGGKKNPG